MDILDGAYRTNGYLVELYKILREQDKENFVDPIEISAKLLGIKEEEIVVGVLERSGLIDSADYPVLIVRYAGIIIDVLAESQVMKTTEYTTVKFDGKYVMYETADGDILIAS